MNGNPTRPLYRQRVKSMTLVVAMAVMVSLTSMAQEKKSNIVTIKWGTGMPIDVIYNYIHKNFEDDGYQDALVNQDIAYRDTRISIIRNDLEMLFNRIKLCYNITNQLYTQSAVFKIFFADKM